VKEKSFQVLHWTRWSWDQRTVSKCWATNAQWCIVVSCKNDDNNCVVIIDCSLIGGGGTVMKGRDCVMGTHRHMKHVILVPMSGKVTFNGAQQDSYGGELLSVICHFSCDLCTQVAHVVRPYFAARETKHLIAHFPKAITFSLTVASKM